MNILALTVMMACGPSGSDTDIGAVDTDTDTDTDTDSDTDTDTDTRQKDRAASLACDSRALDGESVIAAASLEEAAQATIVTSDSPYTIVMPEEGDGWIMVEIPDWMSYLRYFADEGIAFELRGGERMSDLGVNTECPDAGMAAQSWAYHEWGAYAVRFGDENPDSFWFMAVLEQ